MAMVVFGGLASLLGISDTFNIAPGTPRANGIIFIPVSCIVWFAFIAYGRYLDWNLDTGLLWFVAIVALISTGMAATGIRYFLGI